MFFSSMLPAEDIAAMLFLFDLEPGSRKLRRKVGHL